MSVWDDIDTGAAAPPPGPSRYVRRVAANEKIEFLCFSPSWWTVWTHYDGRHTHPHFKDEKKCLGCKKSWPRRWKGYLDVFNYETGNREFLEIAPGLADAIEKALSKGADLRGQRFSVKRGNSATARCRVEFLAHITAKSPGYVLPKAEDPRDTLMSLWGLLHVKGDLGDEPGCSLNSDVG